MPIGPNGEKRSVDPVANALLVARIATGEAEETYVHQGKREGGRKGAAARNGALSPERRREIAQKGAAARWGNGTCDTVEEGQPDSLTAE